MKLTGQAKEDFEKWYKVEYDKSNLPYIDGFNITPLSIRYGVYVDWFDSVGIKIHVIPYNNGRFFIHVLSDSSGESTETRNEARTKAIEKANEIYNNK